MAEEIATTGVIARSQADAGFNAFQGANNSATTTVLIGNIFFGIQGALAMKFTGLGIPQGAIIKSARLDVTAGANSGGAVLNATVGALTLGPDKAWVPPRYGKSTAKWRPDLWGRCKANVRNTAAGSIINTVPGAAAVNQPLRPLFTRNNRLAQRFVVPAGPNPTLGSILMNLTRTGLPPGTLSVQITSVQGGNIPNESDVLAVSTPVTAATIPAGPSNVLFSFTGANQIELTAGAAYFMVLKSDLPYPVSNTARVQWRQARAFFSLGGTRHFGVGFDFGNQNYPGVADIFQAASALPLATPWAMPPFVTGVTYTSPDLTDTIQRAVSDQYYQSHGPIGLRLFTLGQSSNRRIATFDHATLAEPVLRVTYCLPQDASSGGASYGIYHPPPAKVDAVEWIQVLGEDPRLEQVEARPAPPPAIAEPVALDVPVKDPGELEAPAVTPPPVIVDPDEWIQLSQIPTKTPGPGVSPPFAPPTFRDQVEVLEHHQLPTKAPGLEPGPTTPAPPPEVREQADQEELGRVPTKTTGPPLIDATPAPATTRDNTDWITADPPNTTPVRSTARPGAPPPVLAPAGDRGDDTFRTRRIAPPPPADPSRRSITTPGTDRPLNLEQYVYAWAQEVLRWETGAHRFGARNPVPPPAPLVIPREYFWDQATRDRVSIDRARDRVRHRVQRELARLIVQTDAPPAAWREAATTRRGSWWARLKGAFTR